MPFRDSDGGAVARGSRGLGPPLASQRRHEGDIATQRLAKRCSPVHDKVEAAAIGWVDVRGGRARQPLLRDYLALGTRVRRPRAPSALNAGEHISARVCISPCTVIVNYMASASGEIVSHPCIRAQQNVRVGLEPGGPDRPLCPGERARERGPFPCEVKRERERERDRDRDRERQRERERVVTRGLCPNGRKEGRKSRGEFGPGSVRAAKSAKLPKLERSSNRGHEPRPGCTPSSPTKEEKDSRVFMPSSVV